MTAELENEILELLREIRVDCASIQAGSHECLAMLKDMNAMLAARLQQSAAERSL